MAGAASQSSADGEGRIEVGLHIVTLRDERGIHAGAGHRFDESQRQQRDPHQADLGRPEEVRGDDGADEPDAQGDDHRRERPGTAGAQRRRPRGDHSPSSARNSS
jgi:hypothetical protein